MSGLPVDGHDNEAIPLLGVDSCYLQLRGLNFYESRQLALDILEGDREQEEKLQYFEILLSERRGEDLSVLSAEEQSEMLRACVETVIPEDELLRRMGASKETGVPLKIKYGIDPTGADVHLGHTVPMLVLDRLYRMGHDVTFIIGDFTAKIGDPSGRVSSRPPLDDQMIAENMATYVDQIRPLFDIDQIRVVHNSEWLNKYQLPELIGLLSKISVASALQRQDFRTRLEEGSGITMAELLYPVVMALDSQVLDSDIEIGGRDQLLNMQMCRKVMEISGVPPEIILTTGILEGTDASGAKMSKSLGNYIGMTDGSTDIYGKIMSITDEVMYQYFAMLTEASPLEVELIAEQVKAGKLHPLAVKQMLAFHITRLLKGEDEANTARAYFTTRFRARDFKAMDDIPTYDGTENIVEIIQTLRGDSLSALRRLVAGGGISVILDNDTRLKIDSLDQLNELPPDTRFIKAGKIVVKILENIE